MTSLRMHNKTALLYLSAASILAAIFVAGIVENILCRTPLTTDEQAYVFQAETLRDGGFSRPYPPFAALLTHKMIIMEKEAGWVSRYPPGHAFFLLPGVWRHDPYFSVIVGAAITLFLTGISGMLACRGHKPGHGALIAGGLLLCSPWFLFTFATLLSHTSGTLTSAGLLAAYLYWKHTGKIWAALLAGLALGYLFLNRTYTALLLSVPFGLDTLWHWLRRPSSAAFSGSVVFLGGALLGIVALLSYNNLILGRPLQMTYLHYEPLEALGFGQRHYGLHTFSKGLAIMQGNLKLLDKWLWGIPAGSVLAVIFLFYGRQAHSWLILLGAIIIIPLGYIFFFHRGPHETGPGYYFEILPFLAVGTATGIARLLGRPVFERASVKRWSGLLFALVIIAGPLRFSARAGNELRMVLASRRAMLNTIAAAPANALIFVINEGWTGDHPLDFAVFNPRGLKSRPLVMHANDGGEIAAMRYFKARRAFTLRSGNPPTLTPIATNQPYRVFIPAARTHHCTGRNESYDNGKITRVAESGRDRRGKLAFGNYRFIGPGRYTASFEIETTSQADQPVVSLDVCLDGGRIILAERDISGNRSGEEKLEFEISAFTSIEPRVYYTGMGNVRLKSIRVEEQPKNTALASINVAGI